MKHIFPDVPINSGCFAPLHIAKPTGTFLVAEYPRPVAGCASEVAQRVMEAVFGAMGQAIPERMFACARRYQRQLHAGRLRSRREAQLHHVLLLRRRLRRLVGDRRAHQWLLDRSASRRPNRSRSSEQHYPLLFEEYALREGSSGAGRHRGGYGVNYRVRLLRGSAKASFLMDHGREGPPGPDRRRAGGEKRASGAPERRDHRRLSICRKARATSWRSATGSRFARPAAAVMASPASGIPCGCASTSSAATSRLRRRSAGIRRSKPQTESI